MVVRLHMSDELLSTPCTVLEMAFVVDLVDLGPQACENTSTRSRLLVHAFHDVLEAK